MAAERRIKARSRGKKEALVAGDWARLRELARPLVAAFLRRAAGALPHRGLAGVHVADAVAGGRAAIQPGLQPGGGELVRAVRRVRRAHGAAEPLRLAERLLVYSAVVFGQTVREADVAGHAGPDHDQPRGDRRGGEDERAGEHAAKFAKGNGGVKIDQAQLDAAARTVTARVTGSTREDASSSTTSRGAPTRACGYRRDRLP